MKEDKNQNTTLFFNDKEEYYNKYRPGYDDSLIKILQEKYGFNKDCSIAEYGSGTGNFSFMISKFCEKVYSVEPNFGMISKAREKNNNENITYLEERAENTSIEDNIIDFSFAVHSFHYFEKKKFKQEIIRTLKPNGYFGIIWYDYFDENNAFALEWREFVKKRKKHLYKHNVIDDRKSIFKNGAWIEEESIINRVSYDKLSLLGLALSISTMPLKNAPGYKEIEEGVFNIFNKYQIAGKVYFDLHLRMQIGKVK